MEESYCRSSLVLVERPLRPDRSTIRPLGFAGRILRDLSILFLNSAIRLSLNIFCVTSTNPLVYPLVLIAVNGLSKWYEPNILHCQTELQPNANY